MFDPEHGESMQVSFKAPQNGHVSVRVFNLSGDLVRPLFETDVQAGLWFQATWDGKNGDGQMVASGIYFISVQGAGIKSIRRVILIK